LQDLPEQVWRFEKVVRRQKVTNDIAYSHSNNENGTTFALLLSGI
jgi:hypothetical protein